MPDPPSYTAATKLPTYDEAERAKGEKEWGHSDMTSSTLTLNFFNLEYFHSFLALLALLLDGRLIWERP